MGQRRSHDSRWNKSWFFRIKRLATLPACLASMMGRTGVSTIEPPSWP